MKNMVKETQFLCIATDLWTVAQSNRAYLFLPVMELMVIGSYAATAWVLRSCQLFIPQTTLVKD